MSDIPGNVTNVQKLMSHPAFDLKNPNKVNLQTLLCSFSLDHIESFTGTVNSRTFFPGLLTNWRILWLACEFPRKRWVRLQIFGRSSVEVGQTKPSGEFYWKE